MSDTDAVSSAQQAANTLREMVVVGRIGPGTPLREAALAAELDVSRNTLREGIRLLAAEGLVEQHLYSGAVVATIGAEKVRDLYAVRRTLEIRAVQLSVYASDAQFVALEKAIDEEAAAARSGDWQFVGTAGMHFHQALVGLIRSPLLDDFFGRIVAQLRLAYVGMSSEADLHRPWLDRDRRICELLVAGQREDASVELERYLDDSEQMIIDLVRQHHATLVEKRQARQGLRVI
jgi:DNA-binding GntR family transcriptional regulator